MNADHIFTKYIAALDARGQDPCINYTSSVAEYKGDHLQKLLYHLMHTVPGVAEYMHRETLAIEELNELDGV